MAILAQCLIDPLNLVLHHIRLGIYFRSQVSLVPATVPNAQVSEIELALVGQIDGKLIRELALSMGKNKTCAEDHILIEMLLSLKRKFSIPVRQTFLSDELLQLILCRYLDHILSPQRRSTFTCSSPALYLVLALASTMAM